MGNIGSILKGYDVFFPVNFVISLCCFNQVNAKSKDTCEREIICTGNTSQINWQCCSPLEMVHN